MPEKPKATPAASAHGDILPASGIFFRHVKNLSLQNINVFTIDDDAREEMIFDDVDGLKMY